MGATETREKQDDPCDLNNDDLILWFDDLGTGNEEYNFLSNFFIGLPLTLPGVTWEALLKACRVPHDMWEDTLQAYGVSGLIEFISGEHAFAALKFWGTDFDHFYQIVHARDEEWMEEGKDGELEPRFIDACNNAKGLGRSRRHPLRADWEAMKLDAMCAITRVKYAVGRDEAARLLATGDRLLVEGTYWGDEVWGVDLTNALLPGRNWLGSILMMRRAELRAFNAAPKNVRVSHFVNTTGKHNTTFVTGA